MAVNVIDISHVSKEFRFASRHGLRGFLKPEYKTITAVHDISLTVAKGESVAFIGPNGAGKSTTIKILCGILQPTSGKVRVLGLDPLKQRRQLAYRIGTIFGQRSQLLFNLPLIESFRLTCELYALPKTTAARRIQQAIERFDLGEFAGQPVRKLSLGQRMRAEVANSLLHRPAIIFLDEPTIGLDVVAKKSLRQTIKAANKEHGTTIFLTSHDAGDIEAVADRTIVIGKGMIVWDDRTQRLRQEHLRYRTIRITPKNLCVPTILGNRPAIDRANGTVAFTVDTTQHTIANFVQVLLQRVEVQDITVEDTPLEDSIHAMYLQQAA